MAPLADIGLTLPLLLAGLALALGIVIGIAIAAAGIGVAVFGPREVDSLIIPALATIGVELVVVFSGWWTAPPPLYLGLAGLVGIGSAGAQRIAIDHINEESASWPLVVLFGTVIAGVVIGGVLGFVFGVSSGRPALALSAAVVGGVVGLWLGWKGSRPIHEEVEPGHARHDEPMPPPQGP